MAAVADKRRDLVVVLSQFRKNVGTDKSGFAGVRNLHGRRASFAGS